MENFLLMKEADLMGYFQRMEQQIKQLGDEIKNLKGGPTERWLTSTEVPNYLGISKRTWFEYRKQRAIPYSQVGKKICVKQSDLDAFLERHTIKARANV